MSWGKNGFAVSTTLTCDNPRCSCDECSCADCKCGGSRLGELERRVIGVLWDRSGDELTVRQIADVLPDYAYTTVATVLDRLSRKELVGRRTDGRIIRFAATGTRADHTALLMHEALSATHDTAAALARFVETISHSEVAVLRRALDSAVEPADPSS